MNKVEKAVSVVVEMLVFDVITPLGCIAVKGRRGLREVISRRKESEERRQKEASENKEEKK